MNLHMPFIKTKNIICKIVKFLFFFFSLCVAVVVHLQTPIHSQNSYIMCQPLLYGEYLSYCHGFKNGLQNSGQSFNPDLNVKVLNKVTKNDLNFKHLRSIHKFLPVI